MRFQLSESESINFRPVSDSDYALARKLAPQSLDVCPTCGGHEEAVADSGMKAWASSGYKLNGTQHECFCKAQIALYTRYVLANIGTQYMRLDWAEFAGDAEANNQVKAYVDHWRSYLTHGFGLTFASKAQGVGKTWAATHIGKELIKQRQKVYFLDFVQMVDAFCDDSRKKEIEARMRETTFLILDDVRAGMSERQNDLYALKFEVLIRHRTNFNLPTIITTNLTGEDFEFEFERIYSLLAPKQMWIAMNGVDYRRLSNTAITTAEMIAREEVRPIT